MQTQSPVRIFIGSGEASVLERKTLMYSLRKNSQRELDIYVFNGTHNSIEHNDEPPVLADMPLWIKYRNYTEFSNYRWLIPSLCNYQGRAIFLDSDMVCLKDIGELFDADMQGCAMLAKGEAYKGDKSWGMSNVLFDCSKCHFDLEQIFREVDKGLFTNTEFHQMAPKFLAQHPYAIGPLDANWNSFDHLDEHTKLIHYTNLRTQPWKFAGHKHESLWFKYFNEARKAGVIANPDIDKTLSRAYARQDILAPIAATTLKIAAGTIPAAQLSPATQASPVAEVASVAPVAAIPQPSKFKKIKNKLRKLLGIKRKNAA